MISPLALKVAVKPPPVDDSKVNFPNTTGDKVTESGLAKLIPPDVVIDRIAGGGERLNWVINPPLTVPPTVKPFWVRVSVALAAMLLKLSPVNEMLPAAVPPKVNVPSLFNDPVMVTATAVLNPGMLKLPLKFWTDAIPPTTWNVNEALLRLKALLRLRPFSFRPAVIAVVTFRLKSPLAAIVI